MIRSTLLTLTLTVIVVAGSSAPAEAPKKPQWQRMLTGEDAKKVKALEFQIQRLESLGKPAEAVQVAAELLAFRKQKQGADHYEVTNARLLLADLQPQLTAEQAAQFRQSIQFSKQGSALYRRGQFAEAHPLFRQALDIRKKVFGEQHHATAASYSHLAVILDNLTKYVEAEPLHQKVLDIRKSVLGEDHPLIAESYNNLATNLDEQGQYTQAQPLLHKALDIRKKVLGEDHPDTTESYHNLALNLGRLDKHAEAQPLLQKALDFNRKVLGEQHQHTATSYNNLASNLGAQAKFAEAQPLYQKALDINLKVHGEDHSLTAVSYNSLAYNHQMRGQYAQAKPLYQKALDIRKKVFGENHPHIANSYNNLAMNLNAQGRYAEAQPLLQTALDIRKKVFGENHPHTANSYNNLAMNLNGRGKHAEAQLLYWKGLDVRRRVFGGQHRHTASSYNNLGANLNAQGKYAEAQLLYQKALDIRKGVLGEDNPSTATSYNNVAANLDDQGKYAEAQPLHQKALDILEKVRGERHRDTARSYNNLGYNLNVQRKFAEAQPLFQKAVDIRTEVLGENHPETARSYNNLAANLQAQRKHGEAQPLFQKALEIREKVLGKQHSDTVESYNNLAMSLHSQRKHAETKRVLERAISSYEASRLAAASGLDRASLPISNPLRHLAVLQHSRLPDEAWRSVELSLARGLLDQQSGRSDPALTPTERAELTKLRQLVSAIQPQILYLVSKTKRTDAEFAELDALLTKRREAETRLAALLVSASQRLVAKPAAIRKALSADTALLFWIDVGTATGDVEEHWACVVRPSGKPKWERLLGTGANGKWTVDDERLPFKLRIALAATTPRDQVAGLVKQLRAQRVAPALRHLDGVKTLYVVPAGWMSGVPVELLAPERTVSYVPSGTFLARAKVQAPPKGEKLLALGDPIFTPPDQKAAAPNSLPPGGLLVKMVLSGSPAAKARLQPGDVLLKYGNSELTDVDSLRKALAANANAALVALTVWREDVDEPFVREVAVGSLGVVLAAEPAPLAIANRRQTDALLASLRGGNWRALPGARFEIDRLRQMFADRCVALFGEKASEQQLEALRKTGELSKFRYLHFATHGEGNDVGAFESALILAQDKLPPDALPKAGEPFINGQLSAAEVLDFWDLDAELVTLSACETAVGKASSGDGSLGFAQAFLDAGSRSVCLSLWKVDDTATALLMERFYANLLGTREGLKVPLGKAAALDEAKRWLRGLTRARVRTLRRQMQTGGTPGAVPPTGERPGLTRVTVRENPAKPRPGPYAHPRYWAAFVLIGDPN